MKMIRTISLVLSILLFALIPMETFAQSVTIEPNEENQYIVMLKDEASLELLENSYDAVMIENAERICVVDLTENQADRLDRKNYVLSIEEDVLLTASSEEESPEHIKINQWYLDAIGVNDSEKSDASVNIELLDSGVDFSDEFSIAANINLNSEDVNESPIFVDTTGHGTAIASVLCSYNDNKGMEGINPNAQVYSVKVLDSDNQAPLSRIVDGIYWGIDHGMDIINMSFGTHVDSPILYQAVKDAYDAGILMVAAAGNTAHQDVQYPAAYEEVLSVGSVNPQGELSENTSIGTQLDILAPGEHIAAIDFLDSISAVSGTSIATAQVTGIASLLWAKDKTKTNDFIKQLLCSAVNKPDALTETDAGIVDYQNALSVYDEFEKAYLPSQITEKSFEVNNDFDYFDIAVDALWYNSVDGHTGLVNEAVSYAGFAGNAPKIARFACTNLDKYNNKNLDGDKYVVGGPHGAGNYVINLKFLFYISRYIYDYGEKTINYSDIDNYINKYYNNSAYWKNFGKGIDFDKKRLKAMADQVKFFLINKKYLLETSIYNNFSNYSKTSQNRYLGTMVFGIALHLAGDMYAHRTIVPKYTVDGVNPKQMQDDTSTRAMLGSADFNMAKTFYDDATHRAMINVLCLNDYSRAEISKDYAKYNEILYWQYIQKAVEMQVAEFRDINVFLKVGAKNYYEDNMMFCSERYEAASISCKRLAARFKENGTFYTKLIYPKEFTTFNKNNIYKTVKLNNFLGYTKAAQLDYIGVNLEENDWKINSTTNLV